MVKKQSNQISNVIKSKAKSIGFLDCALLPADFLAEEETRFQTWLSMNMHGTMGYMERNVEKRLDPRKLFENAKTVIIVLQNYYTSDKQKDKEAPVLSKYAYGTDYHFVMKEKLNHLLRYIQEEITPCEGRSFVDSAPILERAWARRAGLGWIGKNSNLISIEHGSFFFIGELIIDAELSVDNISVVRDHCGNCTRCIDACPTRAIVKNHVIDARKCISYQTIELKGELDTGLRGKFENRVFGCDICQDVCPWNLKSRDHNEPGLLPKQEVLDLTKNEWNRLEKAHFNQLFRNSAVKRTGFKGIKRNLEFLKLSNGKQLDDQ